MYRVDAIPIWLKPAFSAWSESSGLALFLNLISLRQSMRLEFRGFELLGTQPVIFAIWHENLLPLFLILKKLNRNHIWMNHPLWYMKPIHVLLRYLGVRELALGSTGHDGRIAIDELAQRLVETGASTMMAVDGPKGPRYQLRKGCLYLALKTGLPIIPLSFEVSEMHRLSFTWDDKIWPKRGSRSIATFGAPILVDTSDSIEVLATSLAKKLG